MAAITAAEILYRLTTATGPGNSTAGTPGTSLGGFASTTQVSGTAQNNLFDDVSGAESSAGSTEYRAVAVHNSNTANTLQAPTAYITSEVAGGGNIAIAVDTTATSPLGSSTAQLLGGTGATETAPGAAVTGLAYGSPTTAGTGLAMGDIPFGNVKGLWVRRTVAAGTTALNSDGVTLNVTGDTGAA